MREDILNSLDNPKQLEKLYRSHTSLFKREFNSLHPQLPDTKLIECWNERLNYEQPEISWGSNRELIFVIVASLVAGVLAKFPVIFELAEDFFYPRNLGFIIFPLLTLYFAWKNKLKLKPILALSLAFLIPLVYINSLPSDSDSQTLVLACMHLPLILWAILGVSFIGGNMKNFEKRLAFLSYNGDLAVMSTLVLIAGMLLTGITIGLFSLIGLEIGEFYMNYVVVLGLASAPIVGTYITQSNPQLVNKVSPVIAKVFSPLVLVTLIIYFIAIIISGQDPYNDRGFLLIFNALLIGVMAIILFSLVGTYNSSKNPSGTLIIFLLSITTILIGAIALSAIFFRILEYGITPNRLAVLGSNTLILTNLLFVAYRLWKALRNRSTIEEVKMSIVAFSPLYIGWAMVVTFVFPLVFNFA